MIINTCPTISATSKRMLKEKHLKEQAEIKKRIQENPDEVLKAQKFLNSEDPWYGKNLLDRLTGQC